MITAWTTSGASSLSARPMRIDARRRRGGEHPLVRAGHDLEEQVRAGRTRAEQGDHHDDAGQEPLQRRLAAERVGRREPASSGANSAEEDQRLEQGEDQRERVAQDERDLAQRTPRPCPGRSPSTRGARRAVRGAQLTSTLMPRPPSSRRLRPVRAQEDVVEASASCRSRGSAPSTSGSVEAGGEQAGQRTGRRRVIGGAPRGSASSPRSPRAGPRGPPRGRRRAASAGPRRGAFFSSALGVGDDLAVVDDDHPLGHRRRPRRGSGW